MVELSVTFQLSVSGAGEFGLGLLWNLSNKLYITCVHWRRPNSPGQLTTTGKLQQLICKFLWCVFLHFLPNYSKNWKKIIEICGWVVRNFPVVHKWIRWIPNRQCLFMQWKKAYISVVISNLYVSNNSPICDQVDI